MLHFDPPHFISHVDPALLLEQLGRRELRFVIRHVVEHVEEHSVRERVHHGLGEALGLAHVVALGQAAVDLEAVGVVRADLLLVRWAHRHRS